MKKVFLIFTMVAICVSAIAEPDVGFSEDTKDAVVAVHDDMKTVVSTVYSDAKDLLKSSYPEVKEAVMSIASSLGIAAEHLYGVLVKQYVVYGVKELCVFVVFLVILLCGFKWILNLIKHEKEFTMIYILPMSLIATGLIGVLSVDYNTIFTGLINPEYGAIDYILNYSKTLIK